MNLPRQTYRTAEHAASEDEISAAFAQWARADQLKIGVDDPDKQKSRVDRLLYRETVVAFFEVKTCGKPAGSWITSRRKIEELRKLYSIVRVPVLVVVRFACGVIAYLDVNAPYEVIADWGRSDRNDPADREAGARFQWGQFKYVRS